MSLIYSSTPSPAKRLRFEGEGSTGKKYSTAARSRRSAVRAYTLAKNYRSDSTYRSLFQSDRNKIYMDKKSRTKSLKQLSTEAPQSNSEVILGINDQKLGIAESPSTFYEGELDNLSHQLSGIGYLLNLDGFEYFGEFFKNKRNGVGELRTPRFRIISEFRNEEMNGFGIRSALDGSEIKGFFMNGILSGYCEKRFPRTEEVFKGYINHDSYTGFCQVVNQEISYSGEMRSGVMNGAGAIIEDGSEYKGEFRNGKKHGICQLRTKEESYRGEVRKGIYNGLCDLIYLNRHENYVGEIFMGVKKGFGRMTYSKGQIYYGNWSDDMFSGFGAYKGFFNDDKAFSTYIGEWKNGRRHGLGIYIKNKKEFRGNWKKGLKHGKFVVVRPARTRRTGKLCVYNNDELVSTEEIYNVALLSKKFKKCDYKGFCAESESKVQRIKKDIDQRLKHFQTVLGKKKEVFVKDGKNLSSQLSRLEFILGQMGQKHNSNLDQIYEYTTNNKLDYNRKKSNMLRSEFVKSLSKMDRMVGTGTSSAASVGGKTASRLLRLDNIVPLMSHNRRSKREPFSTTKSMSKDKSRKSLGARSDYLARSLEGYKSARMRYQRSMEVLGRPRIVRENYKSFSSRYRRVLPLLDETIDTRQSVTKRRKRRRRDPDQSERSSKFNNFSTRVPTEVLSEIKGINNRSNFTRIFNKPKDRTINRKYRDKEPDRHTYKIRKKGNAHNARIDRRAHKRHLHKRRRKATRENMHFTDATIVDKKKIERQFLVSKMRKMKKRRRQINQDTLFEIRFNEYLAMKEMTENEDEWLKFEKEYVTERRKRIGILKSNSPKSRSRSRSKKKAAKIAKRKATLKMLGKGFLDFLKRVQMNHEIDSEIQKFEDELEEEERLRILAEQLEEKKAFFESGVQNLLVELEREEGLDPKKRVKDRYVIRERQKLLKISDMIKRGKARDKLDEQLTLGIEIAADLDLIDREGSLYEKYGTGLDDSLDSYDSAQGKGMKRTETMLVRDEAERGEAGADTDRSLRRGQTSVSPAQRKASESRARSKRRRRRRRNKTRTYDEMLDDMLDQTLETIERMEDGKEPNIIVPEEVLAKWKKAVELMKEERDKQVGPSGTIPQPKIRPDLELYQKDESFLRADYDDNFIDYRELDPDTYIEEFCDKAVVRKHGLGADIDLSKDYPTLLAYDFKKAKLLIYSFLSGKIFAFKHGKADEGGFEYSKVNQTEIEGRVFDMKFFPQGKRLALQECESCNLIVMNSKLDRVNVFEGENDHEINFFGIGSIRGIDAKENGIKIDHNMSSRKFIWVSGNDSIALVDKDCQKAMKFRNFWYSEPEDAQTFRPLAVCYSESIQTFFGLIKRLSGDYCLRLLEVIDIFIDKRYAKDVQVMEGSCSKTREVRLRDFDKQTTEWFSLCLSDYQTNMIASTITAGKPSLVAYSVAKIHPYRNEITFMSQKEPIKVIDVYHLQEKSFKTGVKLRRMPARNIFAVLGSQQLLLVHFSKVRLKFEQHYCFPNLHMGYLNDAVFSGDSIFTVCKRDDFVREICLKNKQTIAREVIDVVLGGKPLTKRRRQKIKKFFSTFEKRDRSQPSL